MRLGDFLERSLPRQLYNSFWEFHLSGSLAQVIQEIWTSFSQYFYVALSTSGSEILNTTRVTPTTQTLSVSQYSYLFHLYPTYYCMTGL